MIVGVALFELHIPEAQSLKDKRHVVRSLREKLRNRFEVSVAEVGLNDLHQRARLAAAIVSSDADSVSRVFQNMVSFVESHGGATLLGWNEELMTFDETAPVDMPHLDWRDDQGQES